ncbi:T9SS type A sorting domain-containing protein [Lacinutrix jangbogonensis]|uniref:T9SS type A sorting domain-containing protein n=1 Tax=Lacinutrix jangbogonensis TaxID=1469557 RepID=UPI00053E1E2F|nr:T9SS type A sorting domain-containing protein [Lacinutrix jangbogonensis]
MKKLKLILLTLLGLLVGQLEAQDGYTYTLIDNGAYSYSIAAVPNASASNFATSVQSYGFTIIVPDGVTLSITSSIGSSASPTFFDGGAVGMPAIDGYLITETLGSPVSLPAPSAATTTPIITIQVNGTPITGMMYLLANNSTLATTVTPLKSFMQADMIDDAMFAFTNVVDPSASGLSGIESHMFTTLSVDEIKEELLEFSMHPNPASDIVKIEVPKGIKDIKIEVFDTLGKQIPINLSENNTINVSDLSSGLYLVSIITKETKMTKRLIIY